MISPYLIVLIFLIFFTFLSECSKDIEKNIFPVIVLFLTLYLAFRYGQGSDFYNYQYLFGLTNSLDEAIFHSRDVHSEIGMRIVYGLFGENYLAMNAFIALFSMTMLFKWLRKYEFNRIFSLLIFFPTCYLTYYYSAIRQSISLAIFLGIMLELLVNKKNKQYFLWCIFACSFHISAIILFFLPFLVKCNLLTAKKWILRSICFGFIFFPIIYFTSIIPSDSRLRFSFSIVTLLSYAERLISLFIVLKLADGYLYKSEDKYSTTLLTLYIFGAYLYFAFWSLQSISRLSIYFKALECFLVPYYIWRTGKKQYFYAFIFSIIVVAMTLKNIASYINQGHYYPEVTILNYPYITIFDSKDEIFNYRPRPYRLKFID